MTSRRTAVIIAGSLAAVLAVILRWPELVGIGVAFALLPLALGRVRAPAAIDWREVRVPRRVSRGEVASVVLEVTGDGSAPLDYLSAVDSGTGRRMWLAGGSATLDWPLATDRRGAVPAGPDQLTLADPLGLTTAVVATREPGTVLIVPQLVPVDVGVALRTGAATAWQGMPTLETPQSGARGVAEFHSLRAYQPGDSLRMINWRASARTGATVVRNMTDTDTPGLLILLDLNPGSYGRAEQLFPEFTPDCFEAAVDLAASWCWWGCASVTRLTLATTGADQPLTVSLLDRERALDRLALVEPDPGAPGGADVIQVRAEQAAAATVVVVTGPTTVLPAVDRAGRAHVLTVVAR